MSSDSTQPDSHERPDEAPDESPGNQDYEPPRVEALGTLPESTGMPASPTTFPDDPMR